MAILWKNTCKLKFALESVECYSQIKAYDITKLTTELESSVNVRYRNKTNYFVGRFHSRAYQKHIYMVKVICPTRIVWRRQVTVRFMN